METSYTASSASPAVQLPTNRSLLKFVLLSIITLGIYGLVVMTKISTEINTIAGPYDNKKTMNYCLVVLIFSWLTMGIVPLVWAHRFSNRVGSELLRRNLPYQFDAGTFWLWNVLGSLIVVGPTRFSHPRKSPLTNGNGTAIIKLFIKLFGENPFRRGARL